MSKSERSPTRVLAAAMDDMRKAADVLRACEAALAARPSRKSNVSGFVRVFVLARRPTAADTSVESLRVDLERARGHIAGAAASLAEVFADHGAQPAVERLHVELADAGFDGVLSSLQFEAMPDGQAQCADHLSPVVARLRICEAHTLKAIRQLALQAHGDSGDVRDVGESY